MAAASSSAALQSATAAAAPSVAPKLGKASKLLLAHERTLLESGALVNATHAGSSSVWLEANSTPTEAIPHGMTLVYRPMGDEEVTYLHEHNQLPATQPYQAIIEGAAGRAYSEKYLSGLKWTNTHPSTVVEFCVPRALIQRLFALQHKAEDGALSMGLGDKAGGGLVHFNACLGDPESGSSWRIVKVKRRVSTPQAKRKF